MPGSLHHAHSLFDNYAPISVVPGDIRPHRRPSFGQVVTQSGVSTPPPLGVTKQYESSSDFGVEYLLPGHGIALLGPGDPFGGRAVVLDQEQYSSLGRR